MEHEETQRRTSVPRLRLDPATPELLERPAVRLVDGAVRRGVLSLRHPVLPSLTGRYASAGGGRQGDLGLATAVDVLVERHRQGIRRGLLARVPAACLRDERAVEAAFRHIAAAQLPEEALVVAIPETVALERYDHVASAAARLRELGCGLALEDAGIGWAAVAAVRSLPFTTLCLDRALTRQITTSSRARTLLRSLVETAREHGLETICGPLADEDAARVARAIGVHLGVGDWAGPARPLDA